MNCLKLYVRGNLIPSDPGSINAALEFLLTKPEDRAWAVKRLAALVDPLNEIADESAAKRLIDEIRERDATTADEIEILHVEPDTPGEELSKIVVQAAAQGFVNLLDDHFILTDSSITVNPNNPPQIAQAYAIVGELVDMRTVGSKVTEFATWRLAAVTDACSAFFGEEFSLSQVVAATGKAYNTICQACNVHRAFGMQRFAVPFTLHKEVYYIKDLPMQDKLELLKLAEDHKFTAAEFRKVCSYVRHNEGGVAALPVSVKGDRDTLMERVNQRSGSKLFFFMLDGELRHFKGHASELPDKACNVIDVSQKAFINHRDLDSAPKPLVEWKLPSTEQSSSNEPTTDESAAGPE